MLVDGSLDVFLKVLWVFVDGSLDVFLKVLWVFVDGSLDVFLKVLRVFVDGSLDVFLKLLRVFVDGSLDVFLKVLWVFVEGYVGDMMLLWCFEGYGEWCWSSLLRLQCWLAGPVPGRLCNCLGDSLLAPWLLLKGDHVE